MFLRHIIAEGVLAVIPITPLLGGIDVLDAVKGEYGELWFTLISYQIHPMLFLHHSRSHWLTGVSTGNVCKHPLNNGCTKRLIGFMVQGKRGVWLKILKDEGDLVPIAIKAS